MNPFLDGLVIWAVDMFDEANLYEGWNNKATERTSNHAGRWLAIRIENRTTIVKSFPKSHLEKKSKTFGEHTGFQCHNSHSIKHLRKGASIHETALGTSPEDMFTLSSEFDTDMVKQSSSFVMDMIDFIFLCNTASISYFSTADLSRYSQYGHGDVEGTTVMRSNWMYR